MAVVTPYYEQDGITIYHGDCRDVIATGCERVIWDPPYGFGPYPTAVDFGVAVMMSNFKTNHHTLAVFGHPEILVNWCVEASLRPDEWVTWWPTNKVTARNRGLNQETEHIAIFGEMTGVDELTRPRSRDGARIQKAVGPRAAKHELAK